jgi:hypothetical protein
LTAVNSIVFIALADSLGTNRQRPLQPIVTYLLTTISKLDIYL